MMPVVQRTLPTHELDQQVNVARLNLADKTDWEIAEMLCNLAEVGRSLTPPERKALLYVAAARLRGEQ